MKRKMDQSLTTVFFCFFIFLCSIGCSEKQESPDDERDLFEAEQAKKQILELINNDESSIIWKIETVLLKNGKGSFNISDNFNVLDDEFIFSKKTGSPNERLANAGKMEWRRGDGINFDAASVQDAIQDYFLPNEQYEYAIEVSGNKSQIIVGDGNMQLEVFNENKLKGSIYLPDENAELEVVLRKQIIEEGRSKISFLEFEPFTTMSLSGVTGLAPDLTKSSKNNSLYFSTREDSYSERPQRVIKINLSNIDQKEVIEWGFTDFVTKTSVVIQDRLYIFASQLLWIYDLELNRQQEPVLHGDVFTRFGMSSVKNDLYIYAVTDIRAGEEASPKIFKFNLATLKKEFYFSAPEMKSNSRGVINFDYLYIFGGSSNWAFGDYDGFLRKINLKTKEFSKSPLPYEITRTYSSRRNHEIFYMGLTENNEKNHQVVIYDTNSDSYNVVDTNLKILEPGLRAQVGGLCIIDNYLYILYGAETPNLLIKDWTIYRALLP